MEITKKGIEKQIWIAHDPGTRLYRVVSDEIKFFDIETITVKLTNQGRISVVYSLRVNESSGSRVEEYGDDITKYHLTPDAAVEEYSRTILKKYKEKEEKN